MSISLNNHEQRIISLENKKSDTVIPWRYATKLYGSGTRSFTLPSNVQEFKCTGFNPGDPTISDAGTKYSFYGSYVFARDESYPYGEFIMPIGNSDLYFTVKNNIIALTDWSDGDEYLFIYVR